MAKISKESIPDVGSGILAPKLRNRFRVMFYIAGTNFQELHPYSSKISLQIISIDAEPESSMFNMLRFVFDDDILSEAVSSLKNLKASKEVFDVAIEITDGNGDAVETIKYHEVTVNSVYRKAKLSYECGGSDDVNVSLYAPEILGNLVESIEDGPKISKLISNIISNIRVTIRNPNSRPIENQAIRRIAVLNYNYAIESYLKG